MPSASARFDEDKLSVDAALDSVLTFEMVKFLPLKNLGEFSVDKY